MSTIKRWNAPKGATIQEAADGEFVLASDFEAEIAKRDETIAQLEADNRSKNGSMKVFGTQIAGLQKAVRNRERLVGLRDARIVKLESRYQRDVYGLNNEGDPIGGDPAGGYANDNARLRTELAAIKAQEPVAYIPVDRETGEEWHPVLKKGSGNICDYKPLYAAPVSEAKAHGNYAPASVVWIDAHHVIEGNNPSFIKDVALVSAEITSETQIPLARLNATPVHQVSVPDGWNDGYRSAMNSAATGARQLYVQHCHHHGADGLLGRCKELEQSFIRDADASTSAAPAAPAADTWIPVSERMPEPGEPVQVWCEGAEQPGLAWVSRHADWSGEWVIPEPQAIGYESITHWMPLPAGPAAHRAKGVV